jgi:5-methylcytosine-specific restriction endonuclease McrA
VYRQGENIYQCDLYERDEGICALCGEWVDPSLLWPDLESQSLDHIEPLVRGGTHTWDNVQLAHLGCNIKKNARV